MIRRRSGRGGRVGGEKVVKERKRRSSGREGKEERKRTRKMGWNIVD